MNVNSKSLVVNRQFLSQEVLLYLYLHISALEPENKDNCKYFITKF